MASLSLPFQRWEGLLASVPGTSAYQRSVAAAVVLRIHQHLAWFDDVPLDPAERERLRPRVVTLLSEEAWAFEQRGAVFAAIGPLLTAVLLVGGLVGGIMSQLDQTLLPMGLIAGVMLVVFGLRVAIDARYPCHCEAEILYWLLVALRGHVHRDRDWRSLDRKRALLKQIERVARHVERDLPAQLPSGDATSDAWMRQSADQMADGIRRWKLAVLTPNWYSDTWLTERISTALVSVASGEWDRLHHGDRAPLVEPITVRRLVFERVVALVLGIGLPALALWAAQRTDAIHTQTFELGTLIWAVVFLNVLFNPFFAPTLATMKDVKGLVGLAGKKD